MGARRVTTPDAATEAALTGPLADPQPQARFFERDYKLRTDTVDQSMRLRLDGTARFLQDIANENIEVAEFTDTDPFWIVRRTVIDVVEPISWPGELHLSRWCSSMSTRWTNMRVTVTAQHQTNPFNPEPRPTGRIESEAFWINVNEQGMPSRLSDIAIEFLSRTTEEHRLRWKSMNPAPLPEASDGVDGSPADRLHPLRITDFDPFKHLNNAAYWEPVEEELLDHPDITKGRFRAVIEYLRAIDYAGGHEAITIRRRREGDQLRMWLLIPGADGELVVASTVTVTKLPDDYYRAAD
ncbi:acyl-ACP thioesterase domain-containing protein [Jongsikchunia kroppenstedtii]|uniref:acyl-ACP thioesterase domain-containing protein n=1 Tax=Jongsikchunia kroppenstedtii TaxID=1121721 RepID=UPI0006841F8E